MLSTFSISFYLLRSTFLSTMSGNNFTDEKYLSASHDWLNKNASVEPFETNDFSNLVA